MLLGALVHFIAQLVQQHLMALLHLTLVVNFGLLLLFVRCGHVLNFSPIFINFVAGHDRNVGEHGSDLGIPVLVLLICSDLLAAQALLVALLDFFALLALLEDLGQFTLVALEEGLLDPNFLHRLWNLPQSVVHFPRPEGLENHGLTQALPSFFLLIASSVVIAIELVALRHDSNSGIILAVAIRHMLIELVLVELNEAVRAEQTFLLFLQSLLLVPLLYRLLLLPTMLGGPIDQLLVGAVPVPARILVQLPVLVLGAQSAIGHVVVRRVLGVVLLFLLFILNLHVHVLGLAFGVRAAST